MREYFSLVFGGVEVTASSPFLSPSESPEISARCQIQPSTERYLGGAEGLVG